MPIQLRGTVQQSAVANGADVTLTFDVAPQQGDIVLLFGGHGNDGSSAGVGPNTSGYTQRQLVGATGDVVAGFWYKVMGASPDSNVVCEGGGDTGDGVAYKAIVLQGNTVDPAIFDNNDVVVNNTGASAAHNPGAITVNTVGAWVIVCGVGALNDSTPGTPTNYTDLGTHVGVNDTDPCSLAAYRREMAATGSEDPPAIAGWVNASNVWFTVAIKPAAAAAKAAVNVVRGRAKKARRTAARAGVVMVMGLAAQTAAPTVYELSADPGTYSVTGVQADTLSARTVSADPGSFTVTGVDAGTAAQFGTTADTGSYSVGGVDADLAFGAAASRQRSTVLVLGAEVNQRERRPGTTMVFGLAPQSNNAELIADPGTYSVTGVQASTLAALGLAADPGSYAVTGVQAQTIPDYAISADPGSYVITGVAADTVSQRSVLADPGAYALTGVDATLIYSAAAVTRRPSVLVLDTSVRPKDRHPGVTLISGLAPLSSLVNSEVNAEPGSYAVTGIDATLVYSNAATQQRPAVLVLDNRTATRRKTFVDPIFSVAYQTPPSTFSLNAEPGSYAVTGVQAGTLSARVLIADTGSYLVTGVDATLQSAGAFVMVADPGAYSLTGVDATFLTARVLSAEVGSYLLIGVQAGLTAERVISADPGVYTLGGIGTTSDVGSVAGAGSYFVSGLAALLSYSEEVLDASKWFDFYRLFRRRKR